MTNRLTPQRIAFIRERIGRPPGTQAPGELIPMIEDLLAERDASAPECPACGRDGWVTEEVHPSADPEHHEDVEHKCAACGHYWWTERPVQHPLAERPSPEMLAGDREPVTILYTNHRGETRPRKVLPVRVWWGSTRWHPQPQWLLDVVDTEKEERRTFAIAAFAPKGACLRKRLEALTEAARTAAADLDVYRRLPSIGEKQGPAELARIGRSLEAAARDSGVCLGCGAVNPEEAAERCVPQEDSCYAEDVGLWPERGASRDERRQMDVEHAAAGRRFLAEMGINPEEPAAEFWVPAPGEARPAYGRDGLLMVPDFVEAVQRVEDTTPGDCPACGGMLVVPVTDSGELALPLGTRTCVRCGTDVPPASAAHATPRLAGHLPCGIAADLWDH
ncbi:MAG: hypothetical protein AB1941_10030 [Gemmatimonadota bacterium]